MVVLKIRQTSKMILSPSSATSLNGWASSLWRLLNHFSKQTLFFSTILTAWFFTYCFSFKYLFTFCPWYMGAPSLFSNIYSVVEYWNTFSTYNNIITSRWYVINAWSFLININSCKLEKTCPSSSKESKTERSCARKETVDIDILENRSVNTIIRH